MSLYDSQAPICPICQVLLRPGELQEHMETEIERLAAICLRYCGFQICVCCFVLTGRLNDVKFSDTESEIKGCGESV